MTGISGALRPIPPMKPETARRPEATDPRGLKLEAIGQTAKAAIANATGQINLAQNVQGQVSSAIARGLSYEAFLSIPIAPLL